MILSLNYTRVKKEQRAGDKRKSKKFTITEEVWELLESYRSIYRLEQLKLQV